MVENLNVISLGLNVLILLLLVMSMIRKNTSQNNSEITAFFKSIEKSQERLERNLRDEMAQLRLEMSGSGKQGREELSANLHQFNQALTTNLSEMRKQLNQQVSTLTHELVTTLHTNQRNVVTTMSEMAAQQKGSVDSLTKTLTELTSMNEQKLEGIRNSVEQKLTNLQDDNNKKLEQMRLTVDEKLHATLEQRLGDSFKIVSERLEQVHKGLGEMQNLASGVGDLKRVLTNVKTRGTLGEIQLGNLLEQTLSFDQYEANVATKKGSAERVEFAVKLPSRDEIGASIYIPIDSKFPLEDYQRLLEAQDAIDPKKAGEASRQLEIRIKAEAKSIRDKYINPPVTTDFAIMFLPIEGLYAEVLRSPGLWDTLQREYRVIVTGPTTLSAILNSLQMGFRTLAIQKRSSEVWGLLGAVKTEFGKFGDILDKTQKKLQEASNTIESAATRSRAIERKLRTVEELPAEDATKLLGELEMTGTQ
jgi:DNA recombination protein RmuC